MSDISGQGYGDSHNWKRGETSQVGNVYILKGTTYHCQDCGVVFRHKYDLVPDIFKAMKFEGIPEICPKNKV